MAVHKIVVIDEPEQVLRQKQSPLPRSRIKCVN